MGKRGKSVSRRLKADPDPDPPVRWVESVDEPLLVQLRRNRPALVGFVLSVVQLCGHVAWLALVWWLESTGRAKSLDGGSLLAWVIALLLCGSLLLTGVSLFVNLFYGLRREPRVLALLGLAISFFVGVLATAVVFLQGLRAMSGAG
ncbi:MAG: hypothetical protein ACKPJJ_30815 [Planctomycetaceae bacterium]